MVVAHPGLLKQIYRSEQKNDRRVAEKLTKLLYIDQVPTVHVPSAEFFRPMHALQRDLLVDEVETLSGQLKRLEYELTRFSKTNPAVWQLQIIPGVGPRTADVVVAFIDDPHCVSNSKRVGAYFGLVPSQDQSEDRNHLGHITREGPAVARHSLAETTWQAIRRSPTARAYFQQIVRGDKDRQKTAIVATDRYFVRVMWAMLKHGTLRKEIAQAA